MGEWQLDADNHLLMAHTHQHWDDALGPHDADSQHSEQHRVHLARGGDRQVGVWI